MLIHIDADPAGLVLIRCVAGECEVLTLGIVENQRGRGYARQLLAAAQGAAGDSGSTRMFLEVSELNDAAIALYRQAGFQSAGRRRGYYRDGADALIMTLVL